MTPERMAALHARCFPDRPWSAAEFTDLLQSGSVMSFTATDETGFLLSRVLPPEAEILTLAVAPEARRRGVGSRLVAEWAGVMKGRQVSDLYLEVAADNQAAIGLYGRHGFGPAGRRSRYYARPGAEPVDAVIMHRALTLGQDC